MNDEQLLRYSRHLLLPELDVDGQEKLLAASVLIVGLGGLGSPVALYLAASGVGSLWLADFDEVDLSNLQRQIAHRTVDIGRPKCVSARDAVQALNPAVRVECITEMLSGELLVSAVERVDLVLDCSDNFATRFALNRACVKAKKPLISAAAIRLEGQLIVFDARRDDSPCYRCLYSENDGAAAPTCSENGVLSPLVGVIGALQALEALRLLAGFGDDSCGRLQVFDAAAMEWRKLLLRRDPDCPVCGALS